MPNSNMHFAIMTHKEKSQAEGLAIIPAIKDYINTLSYSLGDINHTDYEEKVLFFSENGTKYKAIQMEEIANRLSADSDGQTLRALEEVIYISNWRKLLEDTIEGEILLIGLVLFRIFDLGLEFDDIPLITSLGGTRDPKETSSPDSVDSSEEGRHPPIIKFHEFDQEDPICQSLPTTEGRCRVAYNLLDLPRGFSILLKEKKFLEFYLKSKKPHYSEQDSLKGRYHFLGKVADHLSDPFIRRFFEEEPVRLLGGTAGNYDLANELAERVFVKQINNINLDQLLFKLSAGPNQLPQFANEVANTFNTIEGRCIYLKGFITDRCRQLDAIDKNIATKSAIESNLKLLKVLSITHNYHEYWEKTYDTTENRQLKEEMDRLGGRNYFNAIDQSAFKKMDQYNSISRGLKGNIDFLHEQQMTLVDALLKRKRLYNDVSVDDAASIFAKQEPIYSQLADQGTKSSNVSSSYKKDLLEAQSIWSIKRTILSYEKLDESFIYTLRETRCQALQEVVTSLEKIAENLPNVYLRTSYGEKFNFGITIRVKPIKIPTLNDIGRELGGAIDAAGNVVNDAGRTVVNVFDTINKGVSDLFRETSTGLNNLKLFVEEEGAKFETYIRRDFGTDLHESFVNIVIKPINWIFCGGKQPPDNPSEDDGCIEAGIQCNSDGTCQATDSQGNPSQLPTPKPTITDEQLQWMRTVELQDTINSQDFSDHLRAWISDSEEMATIKAMLAARQDDLAERIKNGMPTDEDDIAELSKQIEQQRELIEYIEAGVISGINNIKETFLSLLDIAQTLKDAKAAFHFFGENSFAEMGVMLGDSLSHMWDEFSNADGIQKSEMIGIITSEIGMAFVPAGAIAKFGKNALRGVAASSPIRKSTQFISESAHGLTGKISGKRMGVLMGDMRTALKTQGNDDFILPKGTVAESEWMADCWVGPNPIQKTDKEGFPYFENADGSMKFRPVRKKRRSGRIQANFEWKKRDGTSGNLHMDIVDYEKNKMLNSAELLEELRGR